MKKVLIFGIIFLILLSGILALLNFFGIIPLQEWGAEILERLPFITTFQELREENQLLELKLEVMEYELEEILSRYRDLETKLSQKELEEDRKIEEISFLEARVRELEGALTFREQRLANLLAIYREMDPEDVATIILNLEDLFIIEVLTSLRASDAADILSYFPAERAAIISRDIFNQEGR